MPTIEAKLLIIGFNQTSQMGSYLAAAAARLCLNWDILDTARSETGNRLMRALSWRLGDKRPIWLHRFGSQVLASCVATNRNVVITTGRAPLERRYLDRLRQLGISVINYSTDDPWNPAQRAEWFLSALPAYNAVFTTRRANIDDFRRIGVRSVHYLPFAYDPEVHRPWPKDAPAGASSDVLFVGGCDADRLPVICALIDEGIHLALFGGYWDRFSKTRPYWRGIADQDVIRAATTSTRICLCLVRRANRDDHVMRSFEAAAIGGCILAEDTPEHRELFGPDGHSACYFKTSSDMVQQTKRLLADEDARRHLSLRLRQRLEHRNDTYAHRLASILDLTVEQGICRANPGEASVGAGKA